MLTRSYDHIKRISDTLCINSFIGKQKTARTYVKRNGLCFTSTRKTAKSKVISTSDVIVRSQLDTLDLIVFTLFLRSYIRKEAKVRCLVLQVEFITTLTSLCILLCFSHTTIARSTKMLRIIKRCLRLCSCNNYLLRIRTRMGTIIIYIVRSISTIDTVY